MTNHIVNGLNYDALNNTVKAVRSNPDLAKFKFRAQNQWMEGFHVKSAISKFETPDGQTSKHKSTFVFHADEPAELLGTDTGANATEALLHALASCLNATLICHATLNGIKIDELKFELEGDIDINGFLGTSHKERNGFRAINITCEIKSDEPEEKLQHLCELAQKHSPVFDMVTNPTPVNITLKTL